MNKVNYQKILDDIIAGLINQKKTPSLLLHSCCAPCSSYVLFYLSEYFKVTVFYYNPNIYPVDEYVKRLNEQKRLIKEMELKHKIDFEEGDYDKTEFYKHYKGLENEPERGKRCTICYQLRLEETAKLAKENGYEYFTSTLTVSPYKDANLINEIGGQLENKYDIKYLYSDFKKKEGYKKSIEISNKYKLYRQNYCGCSFSMRNEK